MEEKGTVIKRDGRRERGRKMERWRRVVLFHHFHFVLLFKYWNKFRCRLFVRTVRRNGTLTDAYAHIFYVYIARATTQKKTMNMNLCNITFE